MSEHTNQPLPGAALFFPQGSAHVRQNDQSVWHTLLPKRTPAYQPARVRAMEMQRNQAAALHRQAAVEPDLLGGATQKSYSGLLQQPLPG